MTTTYAPKKKKVLRKFKLGAITSCDSPAQEGALQLLIKRDDVAKATFDQVLESLELEQKIFEALSEMWTLNDALRRSIQAIVEDPETYPDPVAAVRESLEQFASAVIEMISEATGQIEDGVEEVAKFEPEDYAIVPNPEDRSLWKMRLTVTPNGEPDARLVETAILALEKKIQVNVSEEELAKARASVGCAWQKLNPKSENLPEIFKNLEDEEMAKKTEDQNNELQKSLDDVKQKLEKSEKIVALSADHRAHYDGLSGDDQEAFLNKSEDERSAIVKNAADANPVIYTNEAGEEFRKSDDPRLVRMAREADEERRVAKRDREKLENERLEKRAESEMSHLPGDADTKIAVLKAIDSIEDEEVRKGAKAIIDAGDTAIAKSFERFGHQRDVTKSDDDPKAKLDELSKQYAEEYKVSHAEAYDAVLKTDQGRALYAESRGS